jgi:hypothetical protein
VHDLEQQRRGVLQDDSAVLQRHDVDDDLWLLLHDDDERHPDVLQLLIVSFYDEVNAPTALRFRCVFIDRPA